ncbi:MAG: hypothetical protein IT168_04945 [Bryobacterales bacterium]|nr:hypothetical protein [Bryobacterales bacterium]
MRLTGFFRLISALLFVASSRAQTPAATTVEDPDVKRLKDEAARLQQENQRLAESKKLMEAMIPKFTGGVEGTANFSGDAAAEAVDAAYEALGAAAREISGKLQCGSQTATASKRIMILSATELNGFDNLHAFNAQSELLSKLLDEVIKPDDGGTHTYFFPAAAIPVAGSVIQSLIDFTKLFRINVDINTKDLTAEEKVVVSTLAANASANDSGCQIFYPEMVPAQVLAPLCIHDPVQEPRTPGEWLGRINARLADVKKKLEATANQLESEKADVAKAESQVQSLEIRRKVLVELIPALIAKLKDVPLRDAKTWLNETKTTQEELMKLDQEIDAKKGTLAEGKRKRDEDAYKVKALTAAMEAGETYRGELLKKDIGIAMLSRLHRTQRLKDVLTSDCRGNCSASLLHLSVQKLSATTTKRTGTFIGTKYSFSGAAIATYMRYALFENGKTTNSKLSDSGTVSKFVGPYKPGRARPKQSVSEKSR